MSLLNHRPRVFISAVSSEFGSTRQRIAHILSGLGYEPVQQEIFGTESGELLDVLRTKIDSCRGLIQVVGHAYGHEPPSPVPGMGRVSFTQFEFLYAREKGKKTWLLFPSDGYPRDTGTELLDLPRDGTPQDPRVYQEERRDLQEQYRRNPRVGGGHHLIHNLDSTIALELAVEKLHREFDRLRLRSRIFASVIVTALLATVVILYQIYRRQLATESEFKRISNDTREAAGQSKAGSSASELLSLLPDRYADTRHLLELAKSDMPEYTRFRTEFERYLRIAEESVKGSNLIRLHETTKQLVSLVESDLAKSALAPESRASILRNLTYGGPERIPGKPDDQPGETRPGEDRPSTPAPPRAPSAPTGLRLIPSEP